MQVPPEDPVTHEAKGASPSPSSSKTIRRASTPRHARGPAQQGEEDPTSVETDNHWRAAVVSALTRPTPCPRVIA